MNLRHILQSPSESMANNYKYISVDKVNSSVGSSMAQGLVAGLSLRRSGLVHVGLVVNKVAMGQDSCFFRFPL
jgi:hypothetical protein